MICWKGNGNNVRMVFLIFGIMSAFLVKFTSEILSALAADMEMTSEPVALDAWKQFYKNISGVGFYDSCLTLRCHVYFMVADCDETL